MKKNLLISLLLLPVFAFAQNLKAPEASIIAKVKAGMPQTLDLLKEVVNLNSGTLNHAGVRAVGEVFKREFDAMGFQTEWVKLPDSLNRAGHFVATRKGNQGKKLFLIGHLDTVFEKSMPFTPFTKLNDSTATGQGANDMKGGDVMIVAALKALHANGLLDNTSITVYFTGDEESSGKPASVSRADFIERAQSCRRGPGLRNGPKLRHCGHGPAGVERLGTDDPRPNGAFVGGFREKGGLRLHLRSGPHPE